MNWQNPLVRQKLFDMINWWLEKGIAGFRIDAIINIKKDLSWTSLPVDGEDGLVAVQASLENAQPIEPFLRELKETCFDPHNAFTVGEVFNETEEELHFFIGEDGMFSSIFDFKQAILGQKGNGWYDFVEKSREVFLMRISVQMKLVSYLLLLKIMMNRVGYLILSLRQTCRTKVRKPWRPFSCCGKGFRLFTKDKRLVWKIKSLHA